MTKSNPLISVYMGNGLIDKGKLLRLESEDNTIYAVIGVKAKDSNFYGFYHETKINLNTQKHGEDFWLHTHPIGIRAWYKSKRQLQTKKEIEKVDERLTQINNPLININNLPEKYAKMLGIETVKKEYVNIHCKQNRDHVTCFNNIFYCGCNNKCTYFKEK